MPTTINTSRPYNPMRRLGAAAVACGLSFALGMSCAGHPHTTASTPTATTPQDKATALTEALASTGDSNLKDITRSDASVLAAKVCAHPGDKPAQLAAVLAPDDQLWSRRFLTPVNAVDFVDQAVLHYC